MAYDLWGRLRYVLSPQFDIYEQVAKVVSGQVADVGSGTGFGSQLLVRNADKVIGYDVDELAVSFAARTFGNHAIDFSCMDIRQLGDIVTHSFDWVVMIDVIEHIRQDALAVQACKKMLKPGGRLVCSTPNRLSRYRKSDYHMREYSPFELKELLKSVFRNVSMVDYKLNPLESDYDNPILAICL